MTANTLDCHPERQRARLTWWTSRWPVLSGFLLWAPVLLIAPAIDAADTAHPVLVWLGLVTIWLTATTTLAAGWRTPRQMRIVLPALSVQIVVSAVICLAEPSWTIGIATLAALTAGSSLRGRPAIATTIGLAVGSMLVVGASSDKAFSAIVTVLLAGLCTTAFRTLVDVVTELQRTRSELALNAVSAERVRISRDLHDVLGHTLSVIVVKSEAIRRLLPDHPDAAARHAGEVEQIGREALTDIRRAVHGYRSARVLDEVERARIALDAAGIGLEVDGATLLDDLPAEQSVVLGWAVREAVTNVVRHSHAQTCRIVLERTDDALTLTVSDDGDGRASASTSDGSGLLGLRERVTEAGGVLTEGMPAGPTAGGRGFAVEVTLAAAARAVVGAAP